jgi:hypothetical protein
MCVAFKPKGIQMCEPCLTLDGNKLNFVSKRKYLVAFIENNKTDADVMRQLRKLLRQNINSFIDRIKNCKNNVILSRMVRSNIQLFSDVWAWWCVTLFSNS